MAYQPQPLRFKPGIQRDGTRLDAPGNWVDGKWVRFTNGKPRKIKGYRMMTDEAIGIPRSFENYLKSGTYYLHTGSSSGLHQLRFPSTGIISALPTDRTPATYTMFGDELWQFGTAYDPITANSATVIAHPGRNLNDISSSNKTSVYIGDASGTGKLTALSGLAQVSGGICIVHPYLTIFGSDGYFGWSAPNNFNSQTAITGGGEAYVTSQKIIRGFPIRGGSGPSGLYFSLNSVIRTSYVGGAQVWAFDTVTDRTSVMSSRSIAMARNDVAYWMGTDGFYMYNGSVTELQNTTNLDWVFDNVNMAARQKCFAFCNTRYGEVWFCFPFGSATECTHAAIYNYRENVWYDTILPNGGRSGGLSASLYDHPIMGGVDLKSGGTTYRVWEHESGTDEVRGNDSYAVQSYIESSDVTMVTGEQPSNKTISCVAVEADVKQTGNMTLTITGNANARSAAVDAPAITFAPAPVSEDGQILRPKAERRQMRFRWESNTAGGYFELGLPVAHLGPGSGRETG